MKKILFIIIQFSFLQSFLCQNNSKKIYVEYQVSKNSRTNKEYLIADSNNALYSTSFIDFNNENNISKNQSNDTYIIKQNRVKINAMKYYSSLKSPNLYFISIPPNNKKPIVALDSMPDIKWKIFNNETKKISDLICIKATSEYRGSKITAYFSPEIPVGFGPFKFKGLPGLIVEVFNDSEIFNYNWKATKIISSYQTDLKIKYSDSLYKTTVVSYKSIIEGFERKIKIANQRFISNAPRGSSTKLTKTTRLGIEKNYEWEKETTQN